jgi:hypothetical protein
MSSLRRAWLPSVFVVMLLGLAAACQPIVLPGTPSPTCPQGTFTLKSESITGTLATKFGTITAAPVPGGSIVLTNTATTWQLKANQAITVSGTTPFGAVSGTVTVNATAKGTYTSSVSTLAFSVGSVTGTASFAGTVGGKPFSGTLALPAGDDLDGLVALHGNAAYSCGASSLSLQFSSMKLNF